jgi:hypothetical protein
MSLELWASAISPQHTWFFVPKVSSLVENLVGPVFLKYDVFSDTYSCTAERVCAVKIYHVMPYYNVPQYTA